MATVKNKAALRTTAVLILITTSIVSIIALQDTIEFSKSFLFFGKNPKITYIVYLYVFLSSSQYAIYFIPTIFLYGWFKEIIIFILMMIITINAVNIFKIITKEPLLYLDPQKYYYQKINLYKI